jgi:hypothetical protein
LFLDKNPRWVTDDSFYEDFLEDYGLGQPVGLPCGEVATLESVIYFSACYDENYVM